MGSIDERYNWMRLSKPEIFEIGFEKKRNKHNRQTLCALKQFDLFCIEMMCRFICSAFLEIENFICSDKRLFTHTLSHLCVCRIAAFKTILNDFIHGMSCMYWKLDWFLIHKWNARWVYVWDLCYCQSLCRRRIFWCGNHRAIHWPDAVYDSRISPLSSKHDTIPMSFERHNQTNCQCVPIIFTVLWFSGRCHICWCRTREPENIHI